MKKKSKGKKEKQSAFLPITGHFFATSISGLFDMRTVLGPFLSQKEAYKEAKVELKKRPNSSDKDPAWIKSWYLIHPLCGWVEGPFLYRADAERNYSQNRKKDSSYCDKGFVAQVRKIVGTMAIFCRDGETLEEKSAREEKFNREFDAAISASNAYWAQRGVAL